MPSQALCPVVLKVCHSPFPSALVTRISGQRSLWEKTREIILMYTYYGFTGSFFPETQPLLQPMENWTKFENWSNDQDFLLGHLSSASWDFCWWYPCWMSSTHAGTHLIYLQGPYVPLSILLFSLGQSLFTTTDPVTHYDHCIHLASDNYTTPPGFYCFKGSIIPIAISESSSAMVSPTIRSGFRREPSSSIC